MSGSVKILEIFENPENSQKLSKILIIPRNSQKSLVTPIYSHFFQKLTWILKSPDKLSGILKNFEKAPDILGNSELVDFL